MVDPLTRIEGHLRIEVEVENGRVKDARSCSTLFRGLETILKGRDPRDAQFFTGRTCGVCTYTHSLASTRALEDAMKIEIPANATLIRNLVLGMQNLHDHVVHFYHLHALDFVDVAAALKADPAKAAKLNASISPRPTSEDELRAVQAKVKALVESGQLGPFTNAYFLGGHPSYYLDPEANLVATAPIWKPCAFRWKSPAPRPCSAPRIRIRSSSSRAASPATTPCAPTPSPSSRPCIRGPQLRGQVYIPDLLLVAGAYKDWAAIGGGVSDYMDFGEFRARNAISPPAGSSRASSTTAISARCCPSIPRRFPSTCVTAGLKATKPALPIRA